MGDRAQCSIKESNNATPVYLYTHWSGSDIKTDVQRALALKQRWDDYEYLTRIILNEMQGDDRSTTGYGIGTEEHGDIHTLVQILPGQKVQIHDTIWTFDEYIKQSFTDDEESDD